MSGRMFLAVLWFLLSPALFAEPGDKFVPLLDKERQQNYQDFVECYYILTEFMLSLDTPSLKHKIEVVYPRMIDGYKDFLERRPDSFLADEIKVFTAELYRLGGASVASDALSPDLHRIKFNAGWKSEANALLMDVIKNYPQNRYFSLRQAAETEEFSAAIAMWHIGAWNSNPHFLARLIIEYPTSQYAVPAAGLIRKMGRVSILIGKQEKRRNRCLRAISWPFRLLF